MKLTARNKKMILLLLEEENYVTVQYIAENVNVSYRTALRELNIIESWLNKKNITLEKKKGTGIRLCLNKKGKEELKQDILQEKADMVYLPEQRQVLLKAELLKNPEITKLYTLTRLLDVTEGTISADIDKLESWMKKFNLMITKKPGLGIYVKGSEMSIRSATISFIYEQFHEAEIINIILNKENLNLDLINSRVNQGILEIMDINNIELSKKLLDNMEKQMNYRFPDNSYIGLVIRISITIHRCRMGFFINELGEFREKVQMDKIYEMVKVWYRTYEDRLPKSIPEEEFYYLVIHIRGAEIQEDLEQDLLLEAEDNKIMELTREVIYIAERETGIYLEDNEKLLSGLSKHLNLAIYRIKMRLDIMNPLLEDIKEMYPDIFQTAAKCAAYIEEKEGIKIPEDEIAYLATHIGAAMKDESKTLRIYRAAIVCTNDIGAVQLLVSKIESVFPNIQIMDIISVMDIELTQLAKKHIELIITTVELKLKQIPSVLVNPILNEEDKVRIKTVLENFLPENMNYGRMMTSQFEDKLIKLKLISDYILQVIHNFLFIEQVALSCKSELKLFISRTITKAGIDRRQIELDFENKEEKGSAILGQKGIALYHFRSKELNELCMMVIRMKDFIEITREGGPTHKADTVIVLAMPVDTAAPALEVLNEITRKIINSDFANTLKQCNKEDMMIELNMAFDHFIMKKVLDT